MFLASTLAIIILTSLVSSIQGDYYWREYTGIIPSDAVVGGKDVNGDDTYIGQAFVRNGGLMVVQIYPEIKEVYAPFVRIKKIERFIKILCGPQQNFYWIPSDAKSLHVTLIDKQAVLGGSENDGPLNIGRISIGSETKIGKINSYNLGNAVFYFNDRGTEKLLTTYEVLVYKKQQ